MSGMNIHKNYPKKVKEIVGMMKLSQHKKINQKTDLMMKIMNIAIQLTLNKVKIILGAVKIKEHKRSSRKRKYLGMMTGTMIQNKTIMIIWKSK